MLFFELFPAALMIVCVIVVTWLVVADRQARHDASNPPADQRR